MSALANHKLQHPQLGSKYDVSFLLNIKTMLTGSCLFRGISAKADPPFPAADAGGPWLLCGSQLRVHKASDQTPKTL